MRPSTPIFAALAFVSAVSADIFVTAPVGTTICNAGQACTVTWQNDAKAPSLTEIGAVEIALYTGGSQQQTFLQMIQPEINADPPTQVTFLPQADLGESGAFYFVRFTSKAFKNPTNPAQPHTGFSARFTINGMTGTFSPEIKSQLQATGTGPIVASSAPATSSVAVTVSSAAPKPTTPVAAGATTAAAGATTASRGAATTSAAAATNGAVSLGSFGGLTAAAVSAAGVIVGMIAMGL